MTSSAPTRADGGLGLGTLGTSLLFLASILVVVSYLTITDKDRTDSQLTPHSFTVRVTVMDDRITTPRTGHVDTDTIADGCTAPADGSR